MAGCLERVSKALDLVTRTTREGRPEPLSIQGRLELAGLELLPLSRVGAWRDIPGGKELRESIMARLTAREPGPDDPEDCGSLRATCSKLTLEESAAIVTDIRELYRLVLAAEGEE